MDQGELFRSRLDQILDRGSNGKFAFVIPAKLVPAYYLLGQVLQE